jgi:hypothetical protein
MKNILKKISKIKIKLILISFLFLTLTYCITITSVIQPSTAIVGETINVTLNIDVRAAEDSAQNIILGVLVPRRWNIESNTVATYNSTNGSGSFSLAPNQTLSSQMNDLYGIGENYGEVKWVAFISNGVVTGTNGANFSGQIQLAIQVGAENVKTQLGYIVGTSGYGIDNINNISVRFTDCMTITGGTNSLFDLCGPVPFPVALSPAAYSFNDIIKIRFDAAKGPTALSDAASIYLCGTVIADGIQKEICLPSPKNLLQKIGPDLWEISIWGKQFFDLSMEANITSISFNFTNESGTIIVKNPDTGEDFQIIPNCNN